MGNKYFVSVVYVLLIIVANWSVGVFGPVVAPINAFLFIGVDLALRDYLHGVTTKLHMFCLIILASFITYIFNIAPYHIAVASSIAFLLSQFADYIAFSYSKGGWGARANKSNIVGAAVDSLIFPSIAFGSFMLEVVLLQFVAKVFGGWIFTLIVDCKRNPCFWGHAYVGDGNGYTYTCKNCGHNAMSDIR